jgi:hypothetical protein
MESKKSTLRKDYQQMSDEDKIAYWYNNIYRGMRCAGEDGVEAISILDRRELEKLRANDPDIDMFMPYVLAHLARMWMSEPQEFVAKVNRQMGTEYEVVHIPFPKKD